MRKDRNLLVLMCLMVTLTGLAESINESQAHSIAARFMAGKTIPSSNLKLAHKAARLGETPSADNAAYYVFHNTDRGYVIIAGDDRAPAVLGYSDSGSFDANDVPEAMQELLEGYAAQISELN